MCPRHKEERLVALWAALGITFPGDPGKWFIPSAQHGEATPRVLCPVVDSPERNGQRDMDIWDRVQKRSAEEMKGLDTLYIWEKAERDRAVQPRVKKTWGNLIIVYLEGRLKEKGARLSPVVPNDRTGDSGHKLKHSRFPLNIRKELFAQRGIEHSHNFLGEILESPSIEILKSWLDMCGHDFLRAFCLLGSCWFFPRKKLSTKNTTPFSTQIWQTTIFSQGGVLLVLCPGNWIQVSCVMGRNLNHYAIFEKLLVVCPICLEKSFFLSTAFSLRNISNCLAGRSLLENYIHTGPLVGRFWCNFLDFSTLKNNLGQCGVEAHNFSH